MPVLMNIFANKPLTEKIFGKHPDDVAEGIEELLKLKPPKTFKIQRGVSGSDHSQRRGRP
jgi:4-hydroxy-3-polyprenylbenzoate decarboxylase